MIEPGFGASVIADLRARGHGVEVADPWTIGRLTAANRAPDGMLRAAATPRLMQAYAIGRGSTVPLTWVRQRPGAGPGRPIAWA